LRASLPWRPRVQLVLAATCFSTAGAAIKWCGFGAWQIAAIRALVPWRDPRADPRSAPPVELARGARGCGYAAAGLAVRVREQADDGGQYRIPASDEPVFVVALAPWLLRERVRAADLAFMGVLAAGLALFVVGGQRHFATAPDPFLGKRARGGERGGMGVHRRGLPLAGPPRRRGPRPDRGRAACGNLIVFLVCLPGALPLASGRAPTG